MLKVPAVLGSVVFAAWTMVIPVIAVPQAVLLELTVSVVCWR
jgi:hypothetical protein